MKFVQGQVVILLDITTKLPTYSANILHVDHEAKLYEVSFQENGKTGLTKDKVGEDRVTTYTEMLKNTQ